MNYANGGKHNLDGCIVVNLFGVPSAGKSTGAAYIFSKLKMAGINAELITEFAKDKVWENNAEAFKPDNQCYMFGEQFYKMSRCRDKVEVLVTDSPLPLSILYNKSTVLGKEFNDTVMNCFNSFNNVSYLLLRDKPYNQKGRLQTEEEANALQSPLYALLNDYNVQYTALKGNVDNYEMIVKTVIKMIKEKEKSGTD